MPWFQRRRAVAEREQDRLWRHSRMKTDMQQLVSKMSELEIVDSFNVIEKLLHRELQVVYITNCSCLLVLFPHEYMSTFILINDYFHLLINI